MLTLRVVFLVLLAQLVINSQSVHPVVFDGRVLWSLGTPRGSIPAADRARDCEANLLYAATNNHVNLNELREIPGETDTILLVSNVFLFAVTDEDARLENQPRRELFDRRKTIALDAMRSYRAARTTSVVVRSLLTAFVILVATIAALVVLRLLRRRLRKALITRFLRVSPTGKLGVLYTSLKNSLRTVLMLLVEAGLLGAGLIVIGTAVSMILGLFPATAYLSESLWSSVIAFVGGTFWSVVLYLPNLLILAVIILLTHAAIRISKTMANAVASGAITFSNFHRDWAQPTHDLVRILLIMFALVVAFPYLPGGNSPALRGVSIFIGVLVSLGSGSAMGNAISGVILTYMRPFQNGDRVKIADTTGDVIEKSLLVTRVRTIKNVEIIIPNSSILGAHILNYSALARSSGLILNTVITIGYDAPWRTVHKLLIDAALKTQYVLQDPRPFVFQTALNDFNVSYELNAFTAEANRMADIYSELHQNIQEEFNAEGVEIMSPNYMALRDGNTIAIPQDDRPANYTPPSFRVNSQTATAGPTHA